jgi:biotin carboxyl carrier protein
MARQQRVRAVDLLADGTVHSIVPGQVAAPFAGVVTLKVAEGGTVEAGQTVATIEAMKMEATITAPVGGTVARVAVGPVQQVEGGDLLVVLRPMWLVVNG